MQEKNKKVLKMSFVDYYYLSGELKSSFKKEVMKALNMPEQTFFYKMKNGTWTKLEVEKIEEIYSDHIRGLFSQLGLC